MAFYGLQLLCSPKHGDQKEVNAQNAALWNSFRKFNNLHYKITKIFSFYNFLSFHSLYPISYPIHALENPEKEMKSLSGALSC